jgi:glutathione S-transferase
VNKKISLADLFTIPHGALLKAARVDILEDTKRPNVARWWKEITGRPSWQAVKDGKF